MRFEYYVEEISVDGFPFSLEKGNVVKKGGVHERCEPNWLRTTMYTKCIHKSIIVHQIMRHQLDMCTSSYSWRAEKAQW